MVTSEDNCLNPYVYILLTYSTPQELKSQQMQDKSQVLADSKQETAKTEQWLSEKCHQVEALSQQLAQQKQKTHVRLIAMANHCFT